MVDPVTIAVISAGSAAGSSLLTIFLTPWLQHSFWRSQKRAELRLKAADDVNRIAAQFMVGYLNDEGHYRPDDRLFRALTRTTARVTALFPASVARALKEMEVMIAPDLGPSGRGNIDNFVQARDAALRALYGEVVPLAGVKRSSAK